jgi:uncharacterized protein
MISWQYRLARIIIHLRIYVVLLFILISLFFLSVLKDIKVETRLEDFLPQRHPFIQVQHRLTDVFGGLNQVSIAFVAKSGTILNQGFLDKIISATEDLYAMDGINPARINSLASRHIKHVVANADGFFVERLLRAPPETPEGMEGLKKKILYNPNVYGRMVSRDFKSTLIQVDFESKAKTSFIFDALQQLKKKYEDRDTAIYIAGRPILEGWMNFYLPSMFKILAASFIVLTLILYLTFRSRRGVILPLLASTMAAIWGMGIMKLLGLRLDPSTTLAPFIILSLGISHSIQVVKRYYEEMVDIKMKSKHAALNTMAHLFLPGSACVLTDGFGFLSLTLLPLPTIKSMALSAGLGVLANFFTVFIFTPCILSWMHRPKILEVKTEEKHKWVDKLLSLLSIFSLNKRAGTIIVIFFIGISLVSLVGIGKIVIGDNTEGSNYLYPHSPYNIAEGFINRNFGGTNSYFILVESPDSLLKADALRGMDNLQNYLLENVPQAGASLSIAQSIKGLNMFMLEGKRENFRIPDQDDLIAQYWFLYTLSGFPYDYDHLISRDEKAANIKFDLKDHKSTTVTLIANKTAQYLKTLPKSNLVFSYAGGDIGVFYAINDIIRKSMVPNIAFITLLIFLYVSLIYRSITAAWLLFLPLIFSNLIVFGIFGFSKTPITTEMLPLVSLSEGLGIDFGIYILARLYDELRHKRMAHRNILRHTLITSGKAVFFSGLIVSSGILVWVFSPILFQARLGLNLCIVLLLNMVTALCMIPVFVWWIKPVFLFGRIRFRLKKRKAKEGRVA